MNKGGIYQIRNLINGKTYIGSAIYFNTRWYRHKSNLRNNRHHNKHLQRSWNKYGEQNFVFEILEEIKNKLFLLQREQYYIDLLKSYDLNFGYNVCKIAGSSLGIKLTEQHKEKISRANKGKNHYNFGKHLSEEHKKKLSKSHLGQVAWNKGLPKEQNSLTGKKRNTYVKQKISEELRGEKSSNVVLTWIQVREIRKRYKEENISQQKLANQYKVARSTIQAIINNRSWIEYLSEVK